MVPTYQLRGGAASVTVPANTVFTLTGNASTDTSAPTFPAKSNLTAVSGSSTWVDLTWTAATDNFGVTGYAIYRGGTQIGTSTSPSYIDTTVSVGDTYSYTVKAYDAAGNMSASSTASSVTVTSTSSVWAGSAVPGIASDSDGAAVELGMKFRSDVAGKVDAIRFYKGAQNTGTHVGHLWNSIGTQLATVTLTGETASGWQQATLSTPVDIAANTTYIVSYYAPVGHYAGDNNYFATQGVDNAPLHALANGVDGANGLYRYGSGGGFPTSTYQASNYWVDVVFSPTGSSPS